MNFGTWIYEIVALLASRIMANNNVRSTLSCPQLTQVIINWGFADESFRHA